MMHGKDGPGLSASHGLTTLAKVLPYSGAQSSGVWMKSVRLPKEAEPIMARPYGRRSVLLMSSKDLNAIVSLHPIPYKTKKMPVGGIYHDAFTLRAMEL